MKIIGNGRLITRNSACPWYDDGAVAFEDGLIKKVGTTAQLKEEFADAEFIDAKGGVIMPGLINTHNHIYSAFARGLSINGYNPKGFLDILDGMWWTLDRHLMLDHTRHSAIATYVDCIKNGVTTIFDHHASYGEIKDSLFAIGEEAKNYGIRSCLCYEVSDRDGKEKCMEGILENEAFIKYAQKDDSDMIAGMFGLHAQFTLSDETLYQCNAHRPEGAGYHVHVAEGIEDLHDCLGKYGKRIVNRLFDMDMLGPQTLTAHCIYVNPHEMELLKATDTMVVHNPESNMGNACGCPPTMEIFRKGILTGLGTDGYTNDMFESMKVANVLHKHNSCNPNEAWAEVPAMLFENNAKIANRYFKTPLGVLKEGAAADIIVVDYDPLTPMGPSNCNGHILFGMTGRSVKTTVANGRVLMKDRELIGLDEAKIMADCRANAADLWKSING